MEITEFINDVLSTFVSYIVDEDADPGVLPQINAYLTKYVNMGDIDVNAITEHMERIAGEIIAMSARTKDYLPVYKSEPCEDCSGGVALIAAHDLDEAHIVLETELNTGRDEYDAPERIERLRYIGEQGVIFDATYRE